VKTAEIADTDHRRAHVLHPFRLLHARVGPKSRPAMILKECGQDRAP